MRFTNLLKIFLMLLALSFFAACSDDDDGPNDPDDNGDNPPSLNVQQINPPQSMQNAANSGDPGAAQATAYIQIANSLASYSQLLNPPQAAKLPSATGEWTWTQQGATWTLTSTETGSTYEMTLTVNGSYGGYTYDNEVIMTASGQLDGSSGQLKYFDPNSGSAVLTFNWENLADGTYHLTIDTNQGGASAFVDMYYYTDGSGSLDINASGGGRWDIDWASDGSGEWFQYDASGGLVDSGTWG